MQLALTPGVSIAAPDDSPGDKFWAKDRYEHAAASAAISSATYVWARHNDKKRWESFLIAIGASLIVGVAKETFDPRIDMDDIRADAIGTVGGASLSVTIDFIAF